VPGWVSVPQAHSRVSNINFIIIIFSGVVDRNPKWSRTLPSLIYFSSDIYRDPPPEKIIIIKLISDTLLWA
jgi:hypothetical protein